MPSAFSALFAHVSARPYRPLPALRSREGVMSLRSTLSGFLLIALIAAVGCARKEQASNQSSAPQTAAPTTEAPSSGAEAEHGGTEAVNTTGSPADIFGRVHTEQTELEAIIT